MDFLYKPKHTLIKKIHQLSKTDLNLVLDKEYSVKGWIRETRSQYNHLFIKMYDGSHVLPLQLIFDDKTLELRKKVEPYAHIGACLEVRGTIVKSPAKGQLIEMIVSNCKIVGHVTDPDTYLPSAKNLPLEHVRREQHLRAKFRTYGSIYRIRSYLMKRVQEFFDLNDCLHLDPNTLVSSDAEGAGETLTVTTLLKEDDITKIPTILNSTKIDYTKDLFGNSTAASLTVSSQLQLEALCAGMSRVYTTNKSYRAEKSKTKRHLCEFTHVEAELAFTGLTDLMDFCEDLLTFCIKGVLKDCRDDLDALGTFHAKGIVQKLESLVKERFARITYDEAIDLIEIHEKQIKEKYGSELTEIPKWGQDLGTYCERFIAEEIFKKPVCVHHFPKDMKSFYMKQCEPYTVELKNGAKETRQCCESLDILCPTVGEIFGASVREENYEKLLLEMTQRKMDIKPYWWYLDLRKNGSTPTAGFGMGFCRLVTLLTSGFEAGNIRDSTPFVVASDDLRY